MSPTPNAHTAVLTSRTSEWVTVGVIATVVMWCCWSKVSTYSNAIVVLITKGKLGHRHTGKVPCEVSDASSQTCQPQQTKQGQFK